MALHFNNPCKIKGLSYIGVIEMDASGIIMELLASYPRCCKCKAAATRVGRMVLIIGESPLYCDTCEIPDQRIPEDLPQAWLVREAERYLDTHGTNQDT